MTTTDSRFSCIECNVVDVATSYWLGSISTPKLGVWCTYATVLGIVSVAQLASIKIIADVPSAM